MTGWRAFVRLHRVEYPLPIHYLCYAVWGACYTVSDLGQLLAPPVLCVITSNLIHPAAMNVLNAAMDVRTDSLNPNKADLAAATVRLGPRRVIVCAATELTFAQALAVLASLLTGRWSCAIFVAVAIALHVLYNIEPVHLKRRGIANPLTLGASFAFLPCLASAAAVLPELTTPMWLIFAGLGASVTGRALWWMIPDRAADAATGTVTLAVRYGAMRTLVVSCLIAASVPVLLGWGLWWRYGPIIGLVGAAVGSAFLLGQFPLLRKHNQSYARMRRRAMTPMMGANVFYAVLPLIAL